MIYAVILFIVLVVLLAVGLALATRKHRAVGRQLQQELRRYGWQPVGDVPDDLEEMTNGR